MGTTKGHKRLPVSLAKGLSRGIMCLTLKVSRCGVDLWLSLTALAQALPFDQLLRLKSR
jgi:hypothetical protein